MSLSELYHGVFVNKNGDKIIVDKKRFGNQTYFLLNTFQHILSRIESHPNFPIPKDSL